MFDMQAMTKFSSPEVDTAMQNNKRKLMQQSSTHILNNNCHIFQSDETKRKKREKIKCTHTNIRRTKIVRTG